MSDTLNTDTLVADDKGQPVTTDTDADTGVEAKSDDTTATKPQVEMREGKLYVDGVRVYSRDDTNRIAANARKEAESKLLADLQVDSFDQVKSVVNQLQSAGDTETDLNVASLRDAVKKREQTVEELRTELNQVKTEYALRSHIGTLKDHMPTGWSTDQKQAVVDLMKARGMLHLDGDTFHIRNGDDFITQDGETPDYAAAVKMVGGSLGLPFGKKGVDTFDVDKAPVDSGSTKSVDQDRMKRDPAYRNAYVRLRETHRGLSRSEITDAMVRKQMGKQLPQGNKQN